MRMPSAAFRCADGCDFRAELTEVVYRFPKRQGLLEVAHDMKALAERSGEEWRALFENRFRQDPSLRVAPTLGAVRDAIAARSGVGRVA